MSMKTRLFENLIKSVRDMVVLLVSRICLMGIVRTVMI
jgi:hypothetical protein